MGAHGAHGHRQARVPPHASAKLNCKAFLLLCTKGVNFALYYKHVQQCGCAMSKPVTPSKQRRLRGTAS